MDFNRSVASFSFRRSMLDLYNVLPGNKKQWVTVEGCNPLLFQTMLDRIDINCDTLIICVEIWAHEDLDKTIDIINSHPKLAHCTKIIATLGYANLACGHRTFKIGWNYFYDELYYVNLQQEWVTKKKTCRPTILCFNGRDAAHRIHLGYHLYKSNLLKNIAFSQEQLTVPLSSDFDTIADIHEYTSLLPIKLDGYQNDHTIKNEMYSNTYVNLITETEIELVPSSRNIPVEIITEKSYKPFFAGQVPIMLAGPGHIAYLKHFGFEMFDDLLPVDFDYMTQIEKLNSIVNLIRNGDEFFEDYYFNNLKRLKHNFDLAKSKSPWVQTLQEIKNLF